MDFLQKKSMWKEKSRPIWSFYCPLCKAPRRVPYRPKPGGLRQVGQVFLTAAFFTLLTWKWFAWKGIVSFIPFWTIFEVVYRTRLRAALGCVQCGFDPYLFMRDVDLARAEVESHWRKKFEEKGIPYTPKNTPKSAASQTTMGHN